MADDIIPLPHDLPNDPAEAYRYGVRNGKLQADYANAGKLADAEEINKEIRKGLDSLEGMVKSLRTTPMLEDSRPSMIDPRKPGDVFNALCGQNTRYAALMANQQQSAPMTDDAIPNASERRS